MTKNKILLREKTCPICGKVISSIYPIQLDYNYRQHLTKHKKVTTQKGAMKGGVKNKKNGR